MLMALLYCEPDRIAAAAPACDQMPYGDAYWNEIFAGVLPSCPFPDAMFETAYITVNNADIRRRLLLLGFDEDIDGRALASELEATLTPEYLAGRAA